MPKKQKNRKRKIIKHENIKSKQIIKSELAVIESIAKRKHHIEQKMHRFVAITALFLLIFTNFLGALLLLPFLLFFEGAAQYTIIAIFAIGFGYLFNMMIHSIKHLGDAHHIIAGIIVPFFALADIIILFSLLDKIKETFKISTTYNYTFIVIIFIVAFLIPYIIDVISGKHSLKKLVK